MAPVEDELNIGCHGEDAVVAPALALQLLQVRDLLTIIVEVEQTGERQDDRLVAEA